MYKIKIHTNVQNKRAYKPPKSFVTNSPQKSQNLIFIRCIRFTICRKVYLKEVFL